MQEASLQGKTEDIDNKAIVAPISPSTVAHANVSNENKHISSPQQHTNPTEVQPIDDKSGTFAQFEPINGR